MPKPPPPKRPGVVKVYRALYKYEAQRDDELTFDVDDILYISESSEGDGWWKACLDGKNGLIPSNYVTENMETVAFPLHDAAKRGNIDFFEECIRNGVSINGLDSAGCTPIHWAAHSGNVELVERLLAMPHCEINVQNKLGDTPLHSAAWKGHDAIVARLLQAPGVRTDLCNKEGQTPFALAAGKAACAALLKAPSSARTSNPSDYGVDNEDDSD